MNSDDLEKLIDRELKQLPRPLAPPTLLPRVLAAVEFRRRDPTYRWAWSNWPPHWRLIFAGGMGIVLVGLAFLEPLVQGVLRDVLSFAVQPAAGLARDARAALSALEAVRRALLELFLGYLVVMGVLMGMASAVLGAALTRMASLGGESQ